MTPADVVWTYSGVRPLYDDGASEAQAATRDYVLELDAPGGAPLLSVFGGKITTYRRLAEQALEKLVALSAGGQKRAGWTARRRCPAATFDGRHRRAGRRPGAPPSVAAEAHASRLRTPTAPAPRVLGGAKSAADLGRRFRRAR